MKDIYIDLDSTINNFEAVTVDDVDYLVIEQESKYYVVEVKNLYETNDVTTQTMNKIMDEYYKANE